jgi:hypothetical protein
MAAANKGSDIGPQSRSGQTGAQPRAKAHINAVGVVLLSRGIDKKYPMRTDQ